MNGSHHGTDGCNGTLLWVGSKAQFRRVAAPLQILGFAVEPLTITALHSRTDLAGLLVLLDRPGADNNTALLSATELALNHGLHTIFVEPPSTTAHYPSRYLDRLAGTRYLEFRDRAGRDPEARQLIEDLTLRGAELRRCGADPRDIARATYPRPTLLSEGRSTVITPCLTTTQERLLRIAFGDCQRIECRMLEGGLSGAPVMELRALRNDSWLTPFVAKFDDRREIFRLVRQYKHHVQDLLPFRGRPSLAVSRCVVLADSGVVVGRFVERGATLAVAVKHDHAIELINDLFGSILRRWWSNSQPFPQRRLSAIGGTLLLGWVRHPDHSNEESRQRLNMAYSRTASTYPHVVHPTLIQDCFSHELTGVRVGVVHGDLNARNVMGQSARAIVIDFTHCTSAPLLLDPAWLEVTLAFDWLNTAYPKCKSVRSRDARSWKQRMDFLYSFDSLCHLPHSQHFSEPHSPFESVSNAVHAIRYHAHSIATERLHYAYCVLAALVRYSSTAATYETPAGLYAYKKASDLALKLRQATPSNVATSTHQIP